MENLADRGIYPVMIAELGEAPKLVMIFDAVINEQHQQSSDITEHPLEDGSVISDFVIQKPLELTLNIVKSNRPITLFDQSRFASIDLSPYAEIGKILTDVSTTKSNPQGKQSVKNSKGISYVGSSSVSNATNNENYPLNQAIRAYETITKLQELGKSLKIYTGLRIYDNMLITSISSKRDISNADSWEATITLKEIRSVKTYLVDNKLNNAKGKAKDRKAKKETTVAPTKSIGMSKIPFKPFAIATRDDTFVYSNR